jgi:hypothetical protein
VPDPVATITGFRAVFKVLSIAPAVYEKLNEWRGCKEATGRFRYWSTW